MKKLKFYALCCRNLHALKRHTDYIDIEDLHIIINTQDEKFESAASQYCTENSITFTITESDGTASTGKNSFIDIFNASDNDYAVLVDGDDFLTPHGVWTYKQLAQSSNPPDIMALEYQFCIFKDHGYVPLIEREKQELFKTPYIGCSDKNISNTVQGYPTRGFQKSKRWWDESKAGTTIKTRPGDPFSNSLSAVHTKWANHCYKYINNWETHCRIVWFSKKATNLTHRFDTEYVVGEDTVIYFEYKHEHMQGNISMKNLFDRWPTYIYDMRVNGVVEANKDHNGFIDKGWHDWLEKLTNKYDELEQAGKMYTDRLPYVSVCTDPNAPDADLSSDIVWDENYKPDVCNLVCFPGKERVIFY
jgi:hypothetical protein